MKKDEEFLSVRTVAKMFGRTTDTVRDWVKYGKVPGFQDTLTGRYMIAKDEVERITTDRLKPVEPKPRKKKPSKD